MPLALAGAFGPSRPEAPRLFQGTGRFAMTFPPSLQAFILWIKCFWKGGSNRSGIAVHAVLAPIPSHPEGCLPHHLLLLLGLVFLTDPPSQESAPQKQSSHHGRAVPEAVSPRGAALRASPGIADASGLPRARGLAETSYYSVPRSSLHISVRFHYRSCSEGWGGGSKAGCLWALFNRHFLIWGKKGDWMLPPGIFLPSNLFQQ